MSIVGIVGYGIVGKAVAAYHRGRGDEVLTYDKNGDCNSSMACINLYCPTVFICVGTPSIADAKAKGVSDYISRQTNAPCRLGFSPEGPLNCRNVYDAVDALTGEKTVIIKSTVMPGVTDELQAVYPQHRIFFVPEFLSEKTAVEDYAKPRRPHVVGVPLWEGETYLPRPNRADGEPILKVLPYHSCKPTFLAARQAELLKLLTNSYYSLKVSFANQAYDLGATQETLDALAEDPWIQPSHFKVHFRGEPRGFSGACLPKDTGALASLGMGLAKAALEYNETLK